MAPLVPEFPDPPPFQFIPQLQLSDADIDRIARRVVEMLRQPEVDPDAQALVDKTVAENMPVASEKRYLSSRTKP